MSISTKLCNPTPFFVEIPYEKGIVIQVEADGSTTLSSAQMDDYRPDLPGSEQTSMILAEEGVFLEDPDLDYDIQALKAIRGAIVAKKRRLEECIFRLQQNHVEAQQDPDPEKPAFKEKLRRLGMYVVKDKILMLEAREKVYDEIVGDRQLASAGPRFDPERTCFATDPPREFASVTALAIFLSENPEIAAAHNVANAAEADAQADAGKDADLDFE